MGILARFRLRCRAAARNLAHWILDYTAAPRTYPVVSLRLDDGSKAGRTHRHVNITTVEDRGEHLVLIDWWGNEAAMYRTDKVLSMRKRRGIEYSEALAMGVQVVC